MKEITRAIIYFIVKGDEHSTYIMEISRVRMYFIVSFFLQLAYVM